MATPPPYPDTSDDASRGPEDESTTGAPRWLTVLGIIFALGLALVFVVLHLTGSIGPGAH